MANLTQYSERKRAEALAVGYSMPITDFYGTFLFTESIRDVSRIRVVNYAETDSQKSRLFEAYRNRIVRTDQTDSGILRSAPDHKSTIEGEIVKQSAAQKNQSVGLSSA